MKGKTGCRCEVEVRERGFLLSFVLFLLHFVFVLCFLCLDSAVGVDWPSSKVTMSECTPSVPWGTMTFLPDMHFTVHCRLFVLGS